MSAKAGFPLALVLSIAGFYTAYAGEPPLAHDGTSAPAMIEGGTEISVSGPTVLQAPTPMPQTATGPGQPAPGIYQPTFGGVAQPGGLTDWILYTKPECCGPVGGDGPLMHELYVRNGPSIPVGGGVLGASLRTGYMFQGGGRALFFNPDRTAAWVVDAGISYNFHAGIGGRLISIVPPREPDDPDTGPIDIQLRQFQRTSVNLGVGREWFLWAWPNGAALRWGAHVGGQLGTIKADWEIIPHTTDMLWAVYLASGLDLEIPWGCATLYFGFRGEWNDMFESDIVEHQNNNNLQTANLLINTGFRY